MAYQPITIGAADAKAGDTLFTGATKINANFDELYTDKLTSTIIVNQGNLATTLGGVIDSTKVYIIDGAVDFTGTGLSISVPSTGLSYKGTTFDISKIKCSDVGYTLFNSPAGGSGNILGVGCAIEVTGSGSKVYNITDSTGFNAFELTRINYNNCTSLGVITGYRQGLESGTGRFGGSPELTLAGNWVGGYFIETSIVRNLTDGAYSLFKAGAGFSMASRFRSNQNIDLPASASFFDFAPSNFPNASTVQLSDCLISRSGSFNALDSNLTPNMQASDLSSSWVGNIGMLNTFVGGKQKVTAESPTVIAANSTFYDLNATWTPSDLAHFDAPSSGTLRHLGFTPVEYRLQASFSVEGPQGNEASIRLRKWDDSASAFIDFPPANRQINAFVGGRDVAFFTIVTGVTLNAGDYVIFQVANNSSNNNLTLELDSEFIIEAR
ncbi:MAG: hypothetical protein Unbinned1520contig1002_7 [Prokaryotic dsDNA virus sp.]|nr:MAG: hypothetical protein Unbinned1520contig1002_7 [Prokaryotic dsDNA virus sp.]|tara:strand:+ start:22638 stop:23954 length:1317 start_codon:yes stop_codon:yes gene_type:complete